MRPLIYDTDELDVAALFAYPIALRDPVSTRVPRLRTVPDLLSSATTFFYSIVFYFWGNTLHFFTGEEKMAAEYLLAQSIGRQSKGQ